MSQPEMPPKRKNAGKPPSRLGEWVEATPVFSRAISTRVGASECRPDGAELIPDRIADLEGELGKNRVSEGLAGGITGITSVRSVRTSIRSSVKRRREIELTEQRELLELAEEEERVEAGRRRGKAAAQAAAKEAELEAAAAQAAAKEAEAEAAAAKRLLEMRKNLVRLKSQQRIESIADSEGGGGEERSVRENVIEDVAIVNERVKDWVEKQEPETIFPLEKMTSNVTMPENVAKIMSELAQLKMEDLNHQSVGNEEHFKMLCTRIVHNQELPHFNGTPEDWMPYKRLFDETNKECKYSNVMNLQRLQKSLKGEALNLVKGLMGLPENVPRILEKLQNRFGQPKEIVNNLMRKVEESFGAKGDRLDTVVQVAAEVDNLTSTLYALGKKQELQSSLAIIGIEKRMPITMKIRWHRWRKNSRKEENLLNLSEWLEEEANVACEILPTASYEKYKRNPDYRRKEVVGKTTEGKIYYACEECGEKHNIQTCEQFKAKTVKERRQMVREKGLCYGCLTRGHRIDTCRKEKICGTEGCKGKHSPLLHEPRTQGKWKESRTETIAHVNRIKKGNILYQVVELEINGMNGEKMKILAALDTFSGYTLIDTSVAKKMGIMGKKVTFRYQGIEQGVMENRGEEVTVAVKPKHNDRRYTLKDVITMENLEQKLPQVTFKKGNSKKWNYCRNVPLAEYSDAKISMLIGQPHAHLIVPTRRLRSPNGVPIIAETPLGWIACGREINTNEFREVPGIFHVGQAEQEASSLDELQKLVKESFTMEDFGVKTYKEYTRSAEDKKALQMMEKTAKRVGNRWEIALLWKDETKELPESKGMAMKRLIYQEKRMDKDENFAQQYCGKIEEYVEKGYLKKITPEEEKLKKTKVFYLPHFGTINPNKPKLRLIFDAAAKTHQGISLNSEIMTGPDWLNPLPSVLFKFRQRAIALTSDIREMFHCVIIREKDRSAQRILWRGMERVREPETYEMQVMMFGTVCSPSCAQYIKNRNAEEFTNDYPEAVKSIQTKFYVDDYLESVDTEDEAVERYRQVFSICEEGGFYLCGWNSNSEYVINEIPVEQRSLNTQTKRLESQEQHQKSVERVLGLFWEGDTDQFVFKLNFRKLKKDILEGRRAPTKQEALAAIMSIFDPLGFLALITVKGKLILQLTWKFGIDWDDELPSTVHDGWKVWLDELKTAEKIRVPRCYGKNFWQAKQLELHIFCDSSEEAYCAIGYFRFKVQGKFEVALVAARTRVASTKQISIPRLELQAALLGTRLMRAIKEGHEKEVTKIYMWTDSRTALCWIRSDGGRHQQFVANRIGEIQEETEVSSWRWVPTAENPADEATRAKSMIGSQQLEKWYGGPSFLKRDECDWPKEKNSEVKLEELELRKERVMMVLVTSEFVMDPKKYSKWARMVRVMAWIKRFIKKTRKQATTSGVLTVCEIEASEKEWIKRSQEESFGCELEVLRKGKEISRKSRIYRLTPKIDNGLLCVGGRLELCSLDRVSKYPIIMDPKNRITILIVEDYHEKANHFGREMVMNNVRQKFHVLSLRNLVKRVWRECGACKIGRASAYTPLMGQLPKCRFEIGVVFAETGMDCFGPMYVTVGRRHEKRYGVIFTCLAVRAVHLEIVNDLSTEGCLMAIKRFVCRRGCPKVIHTDNGRNFCGSAAEIREMMKSVDWRRMQDELGVKGIRWEFIPPLSPAMGGAWESLIRSVKRGLAAVLKERRPREDVLMTAMVEVENMINSRPLTYVPVDEENEEVLTPNHLLIGRIGNLRPENVINQDHLLKGKHWEAVNTLANKFWERWVKEYAPTLTRRTKWFENKDGKEIKVGDIVVLVDSTMPRNRWAKGKVLRTYPGRDNIVRVADVKTQNGTYKRPVTKLAKLDIRAT